MTKGYHIFMGWGMVTATVLTAMFGLPKLAGASAALKEQARWENRAQAFQDIGEASEVEIRSRSQLAARLTAAHLDTTMSNPWMLDLAMTQDVSLSAREMVFSAKQNSRALQCLAEAVYYEARSETRAGQKAVAEVVINRAASKHFPSSICGVVYQGAERTSGCQFSFALRRLYRETSSRQALGALTRRSGPYDDGRQRPAHQPRYSLPHHKC